MFVVFISDNFHYMDEDEAYMHGEFATWPEAVTAAKAVLGRCLAEYRQPGMTAEASFPQYTSFGDDPHISPPPA